MPKNISKANVPQNRYEVKRTTQPIQLTGTGEDASWGHANLLDDFSYPWRDEMPPKTTFKALYDDTHFYFLYRVEDRDIILPQRGLGERDAVNSDRVEIFFKAAEHMNPYYSLEMDALGRVLDTHGRYPRDIDFDWDWPEGQLVLIASIDENGYWVEGSISFESLRKLGMYSGNDILNAGLYRGEYQKDDNGEIQVKWISWVIPDSDTPDFHIPSSFGVLRLVDD